MSVCKWCDVNCKICICPDFIKMEYTCEGDFKDCRCYEVNDIGEDKNAMEKLCRENQESKYCIKTTTGESDGLKEVINDYCLARCDYSLCKERNCDSVKWLKIKIPKLVRQARQDALEEVEKIINNRINKIITKLKAR